MNGEAPGSLQEVGGKMTLRRFLGREGTINSFSLCKKRSPALSLEYLAPWTSSTCTAPSGYPILNAKLSRPCMLPLDQSNFFSLSSITEVGRGLCILLKSDIFVLFLDRFSTIYYMVLIVFGMRHGCQLIS